MKSNRHDTGGSAVHVAGFGATTALGRDAWASAAAVRASLSGFVEHPYMVDTAGEPMRIAAVPWLDLDCSGPTRFEQLLMPAIEQALAPLLEISSLGHDALTGLALATPPPRPGLPDSLSRELLTNTMRRFRERFNRSAVFAVGHAAGLLGVEAAKQNLERGIFDACVVAGVDSYLQSDTLEWLEENDQLHGAGPLNNAWGFVPGEGAGAVLLVNSRTAELMGIPTYGRLLGVGVGFEENQIKTQTVCIGAGLTSAFRLALVGLPAAARVTDIYCDMNGEPYRADEFGFTCLRLREHLVAASDFVAPAECWGDVSAASGPLGVALACIAAKKGYSKGPVSMVWASSESGERGAALLALPTPAEPH